MLQLQFLVQGREHPFPEIPVDALVSRQSRVMDRVHVGFLIRKMLDGMVFEVFDCLLAGELAFLITVSKSKQLIENTEELFVFPVDDVHAYIVSFFPYQTISHIFSSW